MATKYPSGKPVKLLADLQGFPDGRLMLFEIWRRSEGKEEKVGEVYGVTKHGKGVGTWYPAFEKPSGTKHLKKNAQETSEEEKFYFIAKIDDQEAKSGDIVFEYPLDSFLVDQQ
jgi:hypothetical protein